MLLSPVHTSDFLLSIDVNEWINNQCLKSVLPHLNICDWFTHSHLSRGENRTRNRSKIARVNGPLYVNTGRAEFKHGSYNE